MQRISLLESFLTLFWRRVGWVSLIISCVFLVVPSIFVFSEILPENLISSGRYETTIFFGTLIVIGIGWFVLFAFVFWDRQNNKITFLDGTYSGLIIKTSPKFDFERAGKAILGTKENNVYKVTIPKTEFLDNEKEGCDRCFVQETKIFYNIGNTRIKIPVTLKVLYNSTKYDPKEITEKMIKSKIYSVGEFVEKTFEKAVGLVKEDVERLIKSYANQELSKEILLGELLNLIEFPYKILSNFEDVIICLSDPVSSACKGTVCRK